jgi:DNA-binding CsgD family transcriptional regulator
MLQPSYLSVLEVENEEQLLYQLIRFGKKLGFDTINALTILDQSTTQTEFHSIDNTPERFLEAYFDISLGRVDPVMQHCKCSSVPLIWDQDTYVLKGMGHLWEHQALYGFSTGIAVALHLPHGRHFFVGVDRDRPLPADSQTLTRLVAELQLFAVHAHEAAARIFVPQIMDASEHGRLTPRELEALRWTMDGKLAWQVADELKISERTAVFHLNNATRKLGCRSKFQAVLKAIRLGLLA